MKLIFKPHEETFDLIVETARYQRLWRENSRNIRRAFRDITGLDFQQRVITAHVYPDKKADSGKPHQPMHLPGGCQTEEVKLITLVHELCHRLLGGNSLSPDLLGLTDGNTPVDDYEEYEHCHTFLFEYDVIERAMGHAYAELCRKDEERDDIDDLYSRAWAWAMGMPHDQRQRALKTLVKYATPRDQWHKMSESQTAAKRDPIEWRHHLPTTKAEV